MMNPDLHLVLREGCDRSQRLQGLLDEIEALALEWPAESEPPGGGVLAKDGGLAAPAWPKLMQVECGDGARRRIITIRRAAEDGEAARERPAAVGTAAAPDVRIQMPEAPPAAPATQPRRHSREEIRILGAGLEAAATVTGKILGGNLRLGPGFMDYFNAAADTVSEAVSSVGIGPWQRAACAYDSVTFRHCLLVAGYCAAFAEVLGFSPRDRKLLVVAALFQDIGKSEIPIKIRDKVGRLDRGEMTIVRTHPQRGYRLLAETPGMPGDVLDVVLHHHEFLDGSGYPEQLAGNQIGDLVRLTTIASTFAGLAEAAGLREPAAAAGTYRRIQEMDTKLDPILVKAFGKVALATAA